MIHNPNVVCDPELILLAGGGMWKCGRGEWGSSLRSPSLSPPTSPLLPVQMGAPTNAAPQSEVTIRCCTDIVTELIAAHSSGEFVNLNALKSVVAKRHKSKLVPRLVDIISAVPQEWREVLLPKLRAKPVRTASGVSTRDALLKAEVGADGFVSADCSCGGDGETSQMSSHRSHWKHLRVSHRSPVCRLAWELTAFPSQLLPGRPRLGL